ncbi:hypothetical protein TWF106_007849 [Orbilia oligospora]|uniref:Uncharacterized protein n=1 Tax=Orbilia oligospora TaxID=2813651 RepID=A0A6G1LXK7_ORBOL|nr:hypothetical protein TWF788_010214 [Orbilia oligospora]KAF3217886.1 hypothetical protein TWF106_007849 [Orbilia oligospora]KAF3218262.1 hypothetical protein TWF191_008305 [Orbilia oligospora]KAF3236817.1 hypothetical protein TWF192_011273 [Orbilia oligospora]
MDAEPLGPSKYSNDIRNIPPIDADTGSRLGQPDLTITLPLYPSGLKEKLLLLNINKTNLEARRIRRKTSKIVDNCHLQPSGLPSWVERTQSQPFKDSTPKTSTIPIVLASLGTLYFVPTRMTNAIVMDRNIPVLFPLACRV